MLMVQVVMNCYIKDPDGFDRDLRDAGADWVLLSHCEFFESGEERKKTLQNLSFALNRLRGEIVYDGALAVTDVTLNPADGTPVASYVLTDRFAMEHWTPAIG